MQHLLGQAISFSPAACTDPARLDFAQEDVLWLYQGGRERFYCATPNTESRGRYSSREFRTDERIYVPAVTEEEFYPLSKFSPPPFPHPSAAAVGVQFVT